MAAQGEDTDEAQARPAWLQADEDGGATPSTPSAGVGLPGAGAPNLAPSGGSADFIGLASTPPHANGHMAGAGAPPPAPAAPPAAPRNPLDDLLSLSPADAPAPAAPAPSAPPPGFEPCRWLLVEALPACLPGVLHRTPPAYQILAGQA